MLTARSPQPCPGPTLSPCQEKHLHLRNLLRVDPKKPLSRAGWDVTRECRGCVRQGASAEQPFSTPHPWLGPVGPDPPHLQQNFCLDSSAMVGGDTDAFMVGKRLKGPVTRGCACPSCAPSPLLFFFTLFLLTLFARGNMRLTFLSPLRLGQGGWGCGGPRRSHQSCSKAK